MPGSGSALATLFGKKRAPDFALVDTVSGKLVPLPRSMSTTKVHPRERFRPNTGTPDPHHYLNAIDWQQTATGAVGLVLDSAGRSLIAVHAATGEEAVVFERGMGIADWWTTPTADGGLWVDAPLGFKTETIADVRTLFRGGMATAPSQ